MHTMYYNEFLSQGAILKPVSKISRSLLQNYRTFPGFMLFSTTPGLEIADIFKGMPIFITVT